MKKLKGEQGFEEFYSKMYKTRWPRLKESLLGENKYVAVVNPYSGFSFTDKELSQISALSFNHRVASSFERPQTLNSEYLNYYLMDAASILAVEALEIEEGDSVIDLCAAPGGKSLLCAYKLNGTGSLVSNDRSAARRARIHRIFNDYLPPEKQQNHKVTGHDATKWSLYEKSVYDRVLLDVPCSSERHVLVDKKELGQWSEKRTKALAITQFSMLASALDIVKVGGRIVYSTCALSVLENDDIIKKLYQKREGRFKLVQKEFSIGTQTDFGLQVLPDDSGWGPFYLSIIERTL